MFKLMIQQAKLVGGSKRLFSTSGSVPLESSMIDVSVKSPTVRRAETQCIVKLN